MMNLTLYQFSGLQLCKLVGISHHQFQSFKQAGLIENKANYNFNEIIYVFISNLFRSKGKSWLSIKTMYLEVFGTIDNIAKLPFLKMLGIFINFDKKDYSIILKIGVIDDYFRYIPKDKISRMTEEEASNIVSTITIAEKIFFKECLTPYGIEVPQNFYVYQIDLILKQIISNSEKVHLRIDLKKLLNVA